MISYMRSSLKPNTCIHIVDRVVVLQDGISEPHNWKLTLKMIQGNRKNIFQANFFSVIFHLFCALVFTTCMSFMKDLYGNHDYAKSKKEADFVLKQARRPKIFFERSGPMSEELSPVIGDPSVWIPTPTPYVWCWENIRSNRIWWLHRSILVE